RIWTHGRYGPPFRLQDLRNIHGIPPNTLWAPMLRIAALIASQMRNVASLSMVPGIRRQSVSFGRTL
ncbi:MAG: hypothetical protein ACXWJS_07065, partial [Hyphomicrobium sp.]